MHEGITVAPLDLQHRELEARRAETNRHELIERIAWAIRDDGTAEPLRGLRLYRQSSPTERLHGVSTPSFCAIAQGSREVYLGEDCFRYAPDRYLLSTVALPVVGQVVEASPEHPYLSLRLDLEPALVGSVMVEAGLLPSRGQASAKAFDVSHLDAGLLDAVVRIVRLIDSPAEARMLMPLVKREVVYLLLVGAQGARLQHLTVSGGPTARIARAVERLRNDYDKPLRIESLARELGMSASGFHAQFKAVTAMSPLQFQKRIRLQEARRLMMGEDLDAARAGYRVGYDDASHFTREYKRLFGEPPMRDVQRLRAVATTAVDG
jgi:AraC-like DNA-binding protein